MNLILYKPNSNKISYFIENCVVIGTTYKGKNITLSGIKDTIWSKKWTLDKCTKISKTEYKESVSDMKEAPKFLNICVDTEKMVEDIIKKEIAKKYTIEDEIKLIRRQNKEFEEYNKFVETLVIQGKTFKQKYFCKEM